MTISVSRARQLIPALAVVIVAASAAVAPAARTSAVVTATSAAAHQEAGHPVFLPTGEQVRTGASGVAIPAAPGAAAAGPLEELRTGGQAYLLPAAAAPYLGHGLDPRLFQLSALAKAESAGRLPLRVGYSGAVPAVPGLTVTARAAGTVRGYLTAAGARAFGVALGRQFATDHAGGGYGRDGLFRAGLTVALAGAPAAPPAAPASGAPPGRAPGPSSGGNATVILTAHGTNLAGKPDNGDQAMIIDADNSSLTRHDIAVFHDGTATFSVPAGHFWVLGFFAALRGGRQVGTRLVVLPEVTVAADTTVSMAARSADSRVRFVTSRPATVYSSIVALHFLTGTAPAGCCSSTVSLIAIPGQQPPGLIYVSPMPAAPRVGSLIEVTSAQLDSPPGAGGLPYLYDVAYQSLGTVPPQRFVVNQARLATENARFYAGAPSNGYLANFEAFPIQRALGSTAVLPAMRYPDQLIMYLTAARSLTWTTQYILSGKDFDFSGGQSAGPQAFLPGQRLTDDWGAYPLHPVPFVKLGQVAGADPVMVSASRAGDVLGLAMSSFGDNTPGHVGGAANPPFKATGSYQIDQDATAVAGGPLPHFAGFAHVAATLSPARSLIRFVLNAAEPAALNPLSTASRTAWTWWSAHEAGGTLPPGWVCAVKASRSCAAQPLLTLRYGVVGLGLDGSVSPGQQVIRVAVGHLPLAKATPITSAAMSVSFDGGKTWRPARMSGTGGAYAAVFRAPAGALVTLRARATDAAGGSVTQTITDAYRVAAAGAG
jgi:hypothetical protein